MLSPVMAKFPLSETVTVCVGSLAHPVLLVNVKTAVPLPTPVTMPALSTVATVLSLLVQVPPDPGESVVDAPIHISILPVTSTIGLSSGAIVTIPRSVGQSPPSQTTYVL